MPSGLLPSIVHKWKVKVKSFSRVQLFATPCTVAYQAPPSMGFSRQEYWSGLPFPSPGDLPEPGIEWGSPALEADALISEPPGKKPIVYVKIFVLLCLWGFREILSTTANAGVHWYSSATSLRVGNVPVLWYRVFTHRYLSYRYTCEKSGTWKDINDTEKS